MHSSDISVPSTSATSTFSFFLFSSSSHRLHCHVALFHFTSNAISLGRLEHFSWKWLSHELQVTGSVVFLMVALHFLQLTLARSSWVSIAWWHLSRCFSVWMSQYHFFVLVYLLIPLHFSWVWHTFSHCGCRQGSGLYPSLQIVLQWSHIGEGMKSPCWIGAVLAGDFSGDCFFLGDLRKACAEQNHFLILRARLKPLHSFCTWHFLVHCGSWQLRGSVLALMAVVHSSHSVGGPGFDSMSPAIRRLRGSNAGLLVPAPKNTMNLFWCVCCLVKR